MGIFDEYYGVKRNRDGFVSSLKRGASSMVGGLGEIYADVTDDPEHDNALTRFDDRVQANNPSEINSLQDIADNPWLAVRSAAGNAASFLGLGLVGKGLGAVGGALKARRLSQAGQALNSFGAQTAIAGLPSVRSIGEQQRLSGEEENDLLKYATGTAVGGIETKFGIQKMLGIGTNAKRVGLSAAVEGLGKTPFRTAASTFGRAAVSEGAEELVQNPIEQYAGYQDPTSPESVDETLFGGAMGAIGGGVFGAGGGAARGLRHRGVRNELAAGGYIEPGAQTPTDLLRGLENRDYGNYIGPIQEEALRDRQIRDDPLSVADDVTFGSGDLQGAIVRNVGVKDPDPKVRAAQQRYYDTLAQEKTGRFVSDPVTGIERELTVGEESGLFTAEEVAALTPAQRKTLVLKAAKEPTKQQVKDGTRTAQYTEQLTQHLEDGVITQAQFDEDVTLLKQSRFGDVRKRVAMYNSSDLARKNLPDAAKTAKAALPVVPKEAQPVAGVPAEVAPPPSPPPEKPSVINALTAYKVQMKAWLGSTLTPEEAAAVSVVNGTVAESAGDPEVAAYSLRAAARELGVSHETIRQRAQAAETKIEAAAKKAGFDLDTAKELMGMQPAVDALDTVAGGFEGTTRVPVTNEYAGAAMDDFDPEAGVARAETSVVDEAEATDVALADESSAVADPDAVVDAEETALAQSTVDHNGQPIRPVDIEDARLDWKALDGTDLPEALQIQWTKLWIANQDGVLNDRIFHQQYLALTQEADGLRGVPQVGRADAQKQEAGAKGTGSPAPAEPAAKSTPPRKRAKKSEPAPAVPEVDKEKLFAEAWDAQVAEPQGVTNWANLTDDQRMRLLKSTEANQQEVLDQVFTEVAGVKDLPTVEEKPREHYVALKDDAAPAPEVKTLVKKKAKKNVQYSEEAGFSTAGMSNSRMDATTDESRARTNPATGYTTRTYKMHSKGREYLGYAILTFDRNGNVAVLEDIELEEPARGKGYAYDLLDSLTKTYGEIFIHRVQDDARSFWSKNGLGKLELDDEESYNATLTREAFEASDATRKNAGRNESGSKGRGEGAAGAGSEVKSEGPPTAKAVSTDELRNRLIQLFMAPRFLDTLVTIHATQADARASGALSEDQKRRVRGFVKDGHVHLIAENVSKGSELGVILHEIGVHLGMERIIGKETMAQLKGRVEKWSKGTGSSVEVRAAKKAAARAAASSSTSTSEELLAYFVEELVNAGVNPAATNPDVSFDLKVWLKTLYRKFASALKRIGFKNPDALTGQNIVDLAYGAAQMSLSLNVANQNKETQYSEAAVGVTTMPDVKKFTEEAAAGMLSRAAATAADLGKRALNTVVFMHDLVKIGERVGLTSAKGFNDLMGAKDQIRNRLEERIDEIMQRASGLTDQPEAEQFIRDSALQDKWGYGTKADPEFAARFNALSASAQAVIKDVFKVGQETYAEVKRLGEVEINNEYDGLIKRFPHKATEYEKERQKDLKRHNRVLPKREGPYAPLKRFGDHVVVAKSQEYIDAEKDGDQKAMDKLIEDKNVVHYSVEFFDTAGAADARRKQLEPLFPSAVSSSKQENFKAIDELPWSGIAKIKDAIEGSPDAKYKESMSRLATNLYLRMLSESSARKTELKRKGVIGSGDMFRAFASQGRSSAHFIASMTKTKEINHQIAAMRSEARAAPQGVRDDATRVLNEIVARYNQGLDYKETPWTDKALRASSLWMLLSSPAYYLQNATQTYMVAMPVLGGKYGGRAFTELNRAYGDVMKYVGKMGAELDVSKLPVSEAEKAMLTDLRDKGKLDITITSDLGRWASGAANQGPIAGVVEKLYRAAGKVEALNRITTALAAYRLSNGDSEYAGGIVDQTQGNYAGNNAPRFFRANAATKLMTQFRKYQLIQISLMGRLVYDSFKGSTAAEKAAARRALAWLFAQQAMFTGIKGLPIPAVLWMIVSALGGDDDKDWERNFRKWVGDDDTATLLLKGTPAWMGLDLSSRIGMGNAFSILPFSDLEFSKKGYKEAVFGASGAFIGGMGGQVADGLGKMANGSYYKGVEALLPRGLKDGMAAFRMATEGMTTARGDTVLPADEITVFDAALKAVGLPTARFTEFQAGRNDLFQLGEHFKKRDTRVKDAYANAAKDRDSAEMAEVRSEWNELQAAKKRWAEEMAQRGFKNEKLLQGMKPRPLSVLLKSPQEKAKREAPWAARAR